MKSKDFYAWLDTVEADYYETEQVSDNMITVTFCDIDFPTEEELLEEERKEALKQSIKALEDILGEPYVAHGNAVQFSSGKLYLDTAEGLRNALKLLKGVPL